MHDLLRRTQAIFDAGDAAVIRDLLPGSCRPLPDCKLGIESELTERPVGLNVSEPAFENGKMQGPTRLNFIAWLARYAVKMLRLRALWQCLKVKRRCGHLRPAVSELDARLMQDIGLGPEVIRRELLRREGRPSIDY